MIRCRLHLYFHCLLHPFYSCQNHTNSTHAKPPTNNHVKPQPNQHPQIWHTTTRARIHATTFLYTALSHPLRFACFASVQGPAVQTTRPSSSKSPSHLPKHTIPSQSLLKVPIHDPIGNGIPTSNTTMTSSGSPSYLLVAASTAHRSRSS